MKRMILALAVCLSASAAHAQVTAEVLLKNYDMATPDGKQYLGEVLVHFEDGVSWANVMRKDARLYCLPRQLVLTGEQLIDILRRELKQRPGSENYPYQLILIMALQRVFPC
jgi:hypothetical protein